MNRRSVFVTALATLSVCAVALATPDKDKEKPKISDRVYIKMTTSMGPIFLELNQEKAPISTQNFVQYTKSGHYDGTIFHRVMSNFMIQGGGFDVEMKQKATNDPIKNEWRNGLKNDRGTISMARTNAPDSATCQFFINVVDNAALDMPRGGAAYAVFGKVIHGMDVVDKIRFVKVTTRSGHENVPVDNVVIENVKLIDADDAEIKKYVEAARKKEAEARAAAEAAAADEFGAAMKLVEQNNGDPKKGVKTDSGLWYTDVVTGDGPTPPSAATKVKVHYTGWLVNGKKFDSSRDREQPAEFPLNRVIAGWTEGVGSMKVGSRRILVIPYQLAYGESGRPPTIPPKAMLVFDVELLELK